jgi:hypothetical protein
MEPTHPFEGKNDALVAINIHGRKIRPLRSKRSEELITLYSSL